MVILGLLIFTATFIYNLLSDYRKWKEGRSIHHFKAAVIRGAVLFGASVITTSPVQFTVNYLQSLILCLITFLFIWWFLFDGLFNKIRGYKWGFDGSVDDDESWFDGIFRGVDDRLEFAIKLALASFSSFLLYINFISK